jgi:hypothetical protein
VKTLLILLVGLLVAYVLLDLASAAFVEARVEDEFRDTQRLDVDEASFSIDSFPFLVPLAASGRVSATLELQGIEEQGLTIDEFRLDVDGLEFDRTSAFNGRVEVDDLDRATTSLTLSEASIGDFAGVPVSIADDGTITAGGVTAQAELVDGDLVLSGEGIGTVIIPLRLDRYLPCEPEVEVGEVEVALTCVTETLPPIVNRVLGQVRVDG